MHTDIILYSRIEFGAKRVTDPFPLKFYSLIQNHIVGYIGNVRTELTDDNFLCDTKGSFPQPFLLVLKR